MKVIVLNHQGVNYFVDAWKHINCTVSKGKAYQGTVYTTPTDKPVSSRALMDRFPQVDDVIPNMGQEHSGVKYNLLVTESNPILPFTDITKIGISFGDNDFWQTWETALTIIGNSIQQNGCRDISTNKYMTRNHLVDRINKSIAGVYNLSQGLLRQDDEGRFKPAEYLRINPTDIFINGEIEQYLDQNGYDQNREFFIVDILERSIDITSH